MRTIVLAGAVLLAACGGNEREDAAATTTATAPAATTAQAPAAGMAAANAGTYEMTTPDGMVHTAQLAANNTYTLSHGNTPIESGTWRAADEQLCFSPQSGAEACYTGSAASADGTFTMSGPAGTMLNGAIVRKTAAVTS